MMARLSPSLLKQLEDAGFYVFRDPPPTGAVGPLKVRRERTPKASDGPAPERQPQGLKPSRSSRTGHA